MGVAKGIEGRLEGLVEGFFTKVFRSGLQPVEVGRRILREMADGKTLSVNRTYAPNEFRVLIGAEDHARFSQMESGLQREFSELVIEAAKENRWNLMGLPKVTFQETEGMGKGAYKVEASFSSSPEEKGRVSTRDRGEQDPHPSRAIPVASAKRLGLAAQSPQLLVVDEGGSPSERISLTRQPVVIGRMSTNDVVLSDPNVSRRHAELRQEGDDWVVIDLDSTNGTTVNGKSAQRQVLKDGDRLALGTSELIFKRAEG